MVTGPGRPSKCAWGEQAILTLSVKDSAKRQRMIRAFNTTRSSGVKPNQESKVREVFKECRGKGFVPQNRRFECTPVSTFGLVHMSLFSRKPPVNRILKDLRYISRTSDHSGDQDSGTSERGNPFFSSSTCSFVYQSINPFHTCQCWQVVEWTKRSLVLRSGLNPIPCTIGNPATRTHWTELSQGTITRKSGEQLINRTVVKSEISSIRSLHTQHGMGRVPTNDIDYTSSHTPSTISLRLIERNA